MSAPPPRNRADVGRANRRAVLADFLAHKHANVSAEAELAGRTAALESLEAEAGALRRSLSLIEAECDSLAALVESGTAGGAGRADCPLPACPFDLAGRSIVYVGGRTGLVAHFRALVEKALASG